jgi:hypothetical protein
MERQGRGTIRSKAANVAKEEQQGLLIPAKEMSGSVGKGNRRSFDSVPLGRDSAQDDSGHYLCSNQ